MRFAVTNQKLIDAFLKCHSASSARLVIMFSGLLWKPKVHYHAQSSVILVPTPRQMALVHAITTYAL
jgi:hypothetical protein